MLLTFDFCFEVVAFDLFLKFFISFNVSFIYPMKPVNFKDPLLTYFR